MSHFSTKNILIVLAIILLLLNINTAHAQRIYASSQQSSTGSILCLGCVVTDPTNAIDANVETASTLTVSVGVVASTYQDLIFSAKPAAGTPVSVKLGTGDKLATLTALGGITLQAYNGATPVGSPAAASTLLTAVSNSNQVEVSITPAQTYDRIRFSLNGGVAGVLANMYVYEAFYNANGTLPCNSAIDELNGISSALLGLGVNVGGVANPQQAIDGNINTASTINAGVGVVGAMAQQTIIYQNLSVIGDSVRITLSVPNALISAGVLNDITISTYNGNTSNNDAIEASSILTLKLLDLTAGVQKFVVTIAPAKVFDRVQVSLGGIANVLSTLNLYEAQRIIPSPVIKINGVVSNNASICAGSSATFVATAVPNTIFNWYAAATGGSPIFTGATFTTPVLSANATYYVAAMRNGCTDESQRVAVTATVNAIPAAPVITNSNMNVCSGATASFTAQSVAGVTVNWYSAPTGGTLLFSGNTFTTSAITQTTSYYAEAVSGGTCISPTRSLVTATVVTPPAAPTLTAPAVTICAGNVASLSVSQVVNGIVYNWYSTVTGGTSLFTGTSFTTPVLNTSTNYYVEAGNSTGCVSPSRTQASVTVVPLPTDPTLSANSTTVTAGQTASIAVTNSQTGVTYNWFTSASAGTPIFTGSTFTTPALYGTTTYYVNAVNSNGCISPDRTVITINVNVNNNSPCTFANQQTTNVNGLCIGCSITNAVLSTDADTTTAATINVTAGLTGAYAEQTLQFQQAGFAGDTIKLVLSNPSGLLSASVLGQIQVILYNGATQVSTMTLNSNLLKISLLPGAANKYVVLIPATGAYDRVDVRLNSGALGALSSLNIYYALQQYPKPLFSPTTPEVCNGSAAVLSVTSPANGTFNWYTVPTGGTSLYTGTSYTTPILTTNTTYYLEYSRGTCVSPVRYPIQVLVDAPPAAPTITTQNVTVTSGQPATLAATSSNGSTVQWFTTATGGTLLATGNTYTTAPLTTTTTFYAGTTTGSCVSVSRTPVTVTVSPIVIPDITVTPPTVALNPGQTTTFTASSTTPGAVFNWFTTPTGGTSIYTGATFTTPAEFAGITYYAEASIPSTGAVSSSRGTGTVTINPVGTNPTACDASISQTNNTSGILCVGCAVSNAGGSVDADRNTFSQLNVPVGLIGAYASQTLKFANTGSVGDSVIVELGIPGTLASAGVLSQISIDTYNGATSNNDAFNVNGSLLNISLISGTNRFRVAFAPQATFDRVEIKLNSGVAGTLNTLNIYDAVQEVQAPVITTTSATACQGSQSTLTATAPADVTIKWYTSATGGTPIATGNTFTNPVLTATTTYYAESSRTADGCTQAVRTPATVTIIPTPVAPVIANANATVCSGQPATFTVTPVTGITYNWFTSATGGTSIFTGNSFTTPSLTANATYYAEAENSGMCSSSSRTPVNATVTTTPANAVVVSSSPQTCSGSSVTLTASSTTPNVNFNWYTAATGGTPIFTGSQFTTPALTANASYFVEVANGSCISPSRTEADVTVNPLPVAPVITTIPTGGQITSGQTAQISATSTTPNVTFNWYTAASGGTPIFTGPSFTTPVLTSYTTYYVEAVSNSTGCISSTRTLVTITVNQIFSTSCDFASTQIMDINGGLLCALCSVNNPNNSVDADTTTFSQLNLPLGLTGYVAQKLIFGDTGNAGDTVRVKISVPVNLSAAGVLSQLQIASYNGATYNGDRVSLNSSLVKLQVMSDGVTAIVKFVPAATFNAIEVRISGVVSVINNVNIYYASKQVSTPQIAVKTINVCAGGNATFTVSNPQADATYKWYTTSTGGTAIFTGTSFTTPTLSATTNYYVESSRTSNGCANPNRVAVSVNVTALPAPPVFAQSTVQICAGDPVTLTVINAGTGTVNWYDMAAGGTLLFTGANYQVSPITTAHYYAEITNGSCTSSSRTVAAVTVNPRPSAPGLQSTNVQVCAGSTATLQVLSPATGINYQWFTGATGGTAIFAGATFTTPTITQNTTYYVQATDATTGCSNNGARTIATITVANSLSAPNLSAISTSVCNGGSASLSVTNPVNGLQYNWYLQTTGGTPVFTGTTFTVNNLTANVSYYVEASSAAGCVSATRTQTDIIVMPIPNSPQVVGSAGNGSLTTCQGSSMTLNIVNPQMNYVYRWYDAATGGNLLFTGTQLITPVLNANTTYYVEAAQAGNCNPSARTAATITVNTLPTDPTLVSASVNICAGATATLSISNPQTGITYQWFSSPAQVSVLFTGSTYTTGAITANTTFYVAAMNASGCQSPDLVSAQVIVQPAPSAPALANGNAAEICTGSSITLTIANPQSGFSYNWYSAATGGTPLFTGTSFTSPVLTANTTFYVDATNSTGCASSTRTQVNITVDPLPAPPTITGQGGSTNPGTCNGSNATLTATSTTPNASFNWYTIATGGTPIFTGAIYTTPVLTANATYYVETVNTIGGCVSSTRTAVTVTVNSLPTDPVLVSANVNICAGSTASLSVSNPQTGISYQWFDSAAKTNKLFTGVTFVTGAITANTTFYVTAVNATGCQSSGVVSAQVTVQPAPSAPVIANGSAVEICTGASVTLTIASPQSGFIYNWYSVASGSTSVFTGTSFTTPALTASTGYYAEAVNSTGCASLTRAQVNITVDPLPVAPTVTAQGGSTVPTVCTGSSATLTATSTTANVSFNWYTVATGGTPVFTGSVYTTPPVNSTTTFYVEAVNTSGGCVSTTRTAVTVTINSLTPTTPQVNAADLSVCKNNVATVHVSSPDPTATYTWYAQANGGSAIFTGTVFTTPAITAGTIYYVSASNPQSCNPSPRLAVNISIVAPPATPVLATATANICAGGTTTFSVLSPQQGITYNWYDSASLTNLVFTGSSFATGALTNSASFYVTASSGSCSSSAAALAQVTVNSAPAAPTVANSTVGGCNGSIFTLNVVNVVSGLTYNWYTSLTGGTSVFSGPTFVTGTLNSSTIFYVEAVNTSGCISPSRTAVNVTVTQMPAAPIISALGTFICPGSSAVLVSGNTDPNITITWYSQLTGGTALATGNTYTTPALTSTTTYYASASNTTTGCSSVARTAATVTIAAQMASPIVVVTSTTATSITFSWTIQSTAASYSISLDNGATFTNIGMVSSYTISNLNPSTKATLMAEVQGTLPCQGTGRSLITVGTTTGGDIFVPNAFTPNGDGKNDVFLVYGNTLQTVNMSIYDQWGSMLYYANSASAGWDGTYKGKAQPVGVYVYYIEATLQDGSVVKKKGTIDLLR